MIDFPMTCETLVRKIFQCERFDDPLGRLANTDSWVFVDDEFDMDFKCKAWAVVSRLQSEYLDSVENREELYNRAEEIEERILAANSNNELSNLMLEINQIVEELNLSEFPRINYSNTNDI